MEQQAMDGASSISDSNFQYRKQQRIQEARPNTTSNCQYGEQQWRDETRLALKLCSLFLRYPEEEWINNKELEAAINSIKNRKLHYCLSQFLTYTEKNPFDILNENYVKWFDFSERTSLYLTHGIFGDNRERGLAFVKLKMEFAKAGFYIKDDELPDYLPLILEFASVAEEQFVQKIFLIHKKAMDELLTELEKEDNPYAYLLQTCTTVMAIFLSKKDSRQHDVG